MKKTLSIVLFVLLVFLAVACSPETHKHTWNDGEITLPATCSSTGVKTYTCTVCGETDPRSIPATGHKAISTSQTAVAEVTTGESVNCTESAWYNFTCSECGVKFAKLITPAMAKELGWTIEHVHLNDEKDDYVAYKNDGSDTEYAVYKDGEVNEATMFTPKSKVGRCASCDAVMSDYSVVVEETTGNADYALMNGTWVYTALEDSIATKKVFVDVKESKNASGVKSSSEYVVISEYTDKKGWETKAATGPVSTTYDKTTGVRSLTVTVDGSTYKISEKDGKPTLTLSLENDLLMNGKGTLIFKENHNHLYATAVSEGTTAADAAINAKSIYADSYFENMTFLGQNLMDETSHYVSCSECGITNYAVAHRTSDHKAVTSATVCTCGYTANTDAAKGNIYNPVYIYSAEARFDFTNYDTVVEYWNSMDPSKATGTENSADDAEKRTAATSVAKQASNTAKTAYELAGGTLVGSPSQLLYNLADALNTAVSTYGNTDLGGNLTSVESAAEEYDTNYASNPGQVYQAYKTLAEKADSSGTLGTEGVSAAVDALAKAIAEDAKEIAEEAVEKAKTAAIASAVDSELDHFVVLKGTVLGLDYASYTTSGGCKNTFADSTGWATVGSGAQLTAEGFKILGDAFLLCYCN